MTEKITCLDFRLKKIDERFHLFEHLLILPSTFTGCISTTAFSFLVSIP